MFNVAQAATIQFGTIQGIASTSRLQVHPEPQHRPLTRSIANTSRLDVSRATVVSATLVAIHNISRNVGSQVPGCQFVR